MRTKKKKKMRKINKRIKKEMRSNLGQKRVEFTGDWKIQALAIEYWKIKLLKTLEKD